MPNYEKEGMIVFESTKNKAGMTSLSLYELTLKHIQQSDSFNKTDSLEVMTTLSCVEKKGFIEFTGYAGSAALYVLTQKGKDYLENLK